MLTLGSLFDGAGTIPFAAQLCGIQTLWSSEIEKYPCAVTAKRFPNVNQLGDIRTINGAEIEPVDIIAGGSPCQDLSVAGLRAGLEGERSGLFMEQIRVIKEMRNATSKRADEPIRPRYAVWENVPGAFSSNKGEDFRIVLEEFCKIKDENAHIPKPSGGGVEHFWNHYGKRVFRRLASARRSFLGSPPASPKNLACGRFCRRERPSNTIYQRRLVAEFCGEQSGVGKNCRQF